MDVRFHMSAVVGGLLNEVFSTGGALDEIHKTQERERCIKEGRHILYIYNNRGNIISNIIFIYKKGDL